MQAFWICLLLTAAHVPTVSPIINCKLARQMCVNDAACHSITTLIPRLCGQELVACSTVTVTKCTAALRSLVSFQFFQPTCLCKQQRVDPECNTYLSLVFDHPCFSVKQKDKDPYPIHALPTCKYALDACRQEARCSRLYDNFVRSCDFSDNMCLMTDSRACYDAWNQLRLVPVFGCFCPNINKECQQIFDRVHRNPCVDDLPEHRRNATWHSTHYRLHRLLLPPRSAPPAWRRPYAPALPAPPARRRRPPVPRTPARSRTVASSQSWATPGPAGRSPGRVSVGVLAGEAPGAGRWTADPLLVTPLVDPNSEPAANSTLIETLYGMPDQYGQRGPTNVRGQGTNVRVRQPPIPRFHASNVDTARVSATCREDELRSTCHEARAACLNDRHCRSKLEPVLSACNEQNCNRKICMQRLQNFYSAASTNLSMEVALCVCRRDGSGGAECQRALEELHPKCAQQPEGGVRPACHSVAERCQGDGDGSCRLRLERYEQACAVVAMTNLCAGSTADCRAALLNVLGTELRTNCACKGTDITSMYDCRGWERLLFNNPCVVQAQCEFHRQRQEYLRTPPPQPSPPPPTPPPYRPDPATERAVTRPSWSTPASTARSTPRRTTTQRPSTTVRRRQPERPFCLSRKPGRPDDRIELGEGIRYYKLDEEGRNRIERDCSELCMCVQPGMAVCNVVGCAEKRKCRTTIATYHDGTAGLLPYRAGCICFQGDFICMRPPSDRYMLPFGVFLFLGYSKKEEDRLRPLSGKTVKDDTVAALMKVLEKITQRNQLSLSDHQEVEKWPCKLSVLRIFPELENIIIQAKLDDVEASYNNSLSQESLNREKRECAQPLREISFLINSREPVILSHPLLSVFKTADVDVTIPDTSGSSRCASNVARLLALVVLALLAR